MSAIAKYCLTSHEQILENLKSAFGQEATNVCHNSIFKTGIILEIADMQSQTSGFTVSNAKGMLSFNTLFYGYKRQMFTHSNRSKLLDIRYGNILF